MDGRLGVSRRVSRAVSGALLVITVFGTGLPVGASEVHEETSKQAYRMTLQIIGSMSSCSDEWSSPEYYATASRRDPEVEKELAGVQNELQRLEPRVEAFDERIEPLLPREHNTVPLTDDEQKELEALRDRRQEIQQTIEKQDQLPPEERRIFEGERSEINMSVKRLENSIPLTEEEVHFLRNQREQRAPLKARRNVLTELEANLASKTSMKTPGTLRVYLNDTLQLKLMESDAFADDTCATWPLTLDKEVLDRGGIELKNGDRPLLRLWVQPDLSTSVDDEDST